MDPEAGGWVEADFEVTIENWANDEDGGHSVVRRTVQGHVFRGFGVHKWLHPDHVPEPGEHPEAGSCYGIVHLGTGRWVASFPADYYTLSRAMDKGKEIALSGMWREVPPQAAPPPWTSLSDPDDPHQPGDVGIVFIDGEFHEVCF